MVALDIGIVFEGYIVVHIVAAFAVIAALFSACIAVIRSAGFNVKQARHIEIKISNIYINTKRFRQSRSLLRKRPAKIRTNTELLLPLMEFPPSKFLEAESYVVGEVMKFEGADN